MAASGEPSFDSALTDFNEGRLTKALAVVRMGNPSARMLRLRTLNRLRRHFRVIEEAEALLHSYPEAECRLECNLLRAGALIHLRQLDDASKVLAPDTKKSLNPGLLAESLYVNASLQLARHDLLGAKNFCRESLSVRGHDEKEDSIWRRAFVRAQVFESLSIVAMASGRNLTARAYLQAALQLLESTPNFNTPLYAALLANLASLTREHNGYADSRFVYERLRRIKWTDDLKRYRAFTRRAMIWYELAYGSLERARSDMEIAQDEDADSVSRLQIMAESVLVFGHTTVSRRNLVEAARLVPLTRWDRDEDRFALLSLTRAVATTSAEAARRLYSIYKKISVPLEALRTHNFVNRQRADEAIAEAAVSSAEGRVPRALVALQTAFETYDKVGLEWRAGLAAAEIASITGSTFFREYAARIALNREGTWLARKLLAS